MALATLDRPLGSFKIFGHIAKIEEQEDGTIMVYGVASSPARDSAGEIISADAMRDALPDYSKFPALREMHQPLAAGKVVEASVDPEGVTNIVAHVVDPIAILKVQQEVYLGFSIGGKVLARDPADRTIITGLRLVEISLVDSPCNPDAILSMWKADTMSDFKPLADDVIARAKKLAKAAGTQRFKEFLFEAGQELISEHLLKAAEAGEISLEAPPAAAEPAAAAEAEPAAEPAPAAAEPGKEAIAEVAPPAGEQAPEAAAEAELEAPASEAEPGAAEGAAAEEAIEAAAQPDPAAALADAIQKGQQAIDNAAEPPAEPAAPFADLAKASAALKGMSLEGDLAKGLYSVSRFADLLQSFAYLQECVACEANCENDDSAIPAQLRDAIANLGQILVAMTQEEVAELLAALSPAGEAAPEFIYAGEEIELARQIVDLVKGDESLMAKGAERILEAPPAPEGEGIEKSAREIELEAEVERLNGALGAAAPAVEDLTSKFEGTIEGLRDQISELSKRFADEPLPPKTAGPAAVRAVSKAKDSAGGPGAESEDLESLSDDQFKKAWDELSEAERGQILVKLALSRPHVIAQRA